MGVFGTEKADGGSDLGEVYNGGHPAATGSCRYAEKLLPLVYEELRKLATAKMAQ